MAVVVPDQVVAQILSALRDNVSSGVVVERVGHAGLAVRAPWSTGRHCSGSLQFVAFRVPRTRLPFRRPPAITLADLAERYMACVACVNTVAEHTPGTWQADLIAPLTGHVAVSGDRVTAWVTDDRGARLDLPAITAGVGDVTSA